MGEHRVIFLHLMVLDRVILSHLVFIFWYLKVYRMMEGAEHKNLLSGLKVVRQTPLVSHLFFADDLLIFCRANTDEVCVLKKIFADFQNVSGQLINYEKSACLLPSALHHKCRSFFTENASYAGSPIRHKLSWSRIMVLAGKR